jgi:hypothetical protein
MNGRKWSGYHIVGGEANGWKSSFVTAPSAAASVAPSMYIPLDGGDAAALRFIGVGTAGQVCGPITIYGMNYHKSTNPAYNPNAAFHETNNNPFNYLYTAQLYSGSTSITLGVTSLVNSFNRASSAYFDLITTETTAGTPKVQNDTAFGSKATGNQTAVVSIANGFAEFLFGNLGKYDGLGIGVGVIVPVTEMACLANIRNG